MQLTEGEIIRKYAKQSRYCTRNTLLPYEYEFSCISCGLNVTKRKNELRKFSGKKSNLSID